MTILPQLERSLIDAAGRTEA
ncbi:MAG: hypothetical protein JWM73_2579, partial [Solirubrobacterales bacterium]|nr:hypothetical protein [Solirubrobacterales bacterium]